MAEKNIVNDNHIIITNTNSTIKKEKNSSIELLRIICIFLIIAIHYVWYGGYETFSYRTFGGMNTIFLQSFLMFGNAACSIFALISGYFLIEKSSKNHFKRIIPLIAELFFYSISIWAIMYLFKLVPVSFTETIKSFFPIFWENWYVVYYIIFYLFIPFINPGLLSLSKNKYKLLLLITYIVWSIIPTFTGNQWSFGNFDFFIVMYMTGAYIKLHIKKQYKYFKWISMVSAILLILSVIVFDILGILLKSDSFIENANYFGLKNSILAVIWSISTFMTFINLKFKNKFINGISSSVFGIYLIHDNLLTRKFIWQTIFPNINYLNNPYLHFIIKVSLIFIICLLIDFLRKNTIGKICYKWFNNNYKKIQKWIKEKTTKLVIKYRKEENKNEK